MLNTILYFTTLHYTTLHYTTLHYTTLHYSTLHYTTLHSLLSVIIPLHTITFITVFLNYYPYLFTLQGLILSGLCGSTVPVYMISDVGHLPMRKHNGLDFVTLINHAYVRARHIKEDSPRFSKSLLGKEGEEGGGSALHDSTHSYYSTECTLNNMTDFYHSILTKRRKSLSKNSDCLPCPYVANIDGNEVTISGHHFPINEKAIQSTIDKHFFQPGKCF